MYIFTDGNKTDTIYYTSSTDYNPVTDQLPLVNAVLTDSRLVHHILSWCEVAMLVVSKAKKDNINIKHTNLHPDIVFYSGFNPPIVSIVFRSLNYFLIMQNIA